MVFGFLLGLGMIGILLAVLSFAGWIWAIIDIAVNQKKETGWKIIWLIICILLGIIGVIIYYFASGRKKKK
jgi:uncharacterized BrkB/YihY/UPF0761 family membrane protein